MIHGLFETHIHVRDLQRSSYFYEHVLGLQEGYVDEARRVRFYWIGPRGQAMLGLWEKEPSAIVKQHFAFQSSTDDMKKAVHFLKTRGLPVWNFLDDGTERPFVFAWMPAVSIYFSDPDGHSLEFISMLPDEPRPDLGVVPWEQWEAMHGRAF
ncbi:VOC family protein [Brevibacillus humidisoli]|uniref:VOC family protein n=1 Tax=Brevibacillus humidisoli TaxID=2895522 RepID=UPI001E385A43|nr:VOC family protein [Brevibacillus humidisoli]UFJ43127.1 VOC family protein [Brevibacillus humidisoli]